MNHDLTEAQFDDYLEFLRESLLAARMACYGSDVTKAGDLVDMLHNLPTFLQKSSDGASASWSVSGFYKLYIEPMAKIYANLPIPWDRVPRDEQDGAEARFVFVVQHVHVHDAGDEDVKFIGVYATLEEATRAKERLLVQPGFRETPEGFHIQRYKLNEDHWTDGYVTLPHA